MAERRRRLRFSLAALLVVMTGLTLWLGRSTFFARRQTKAVASVQSAEGIVKFDESSIPEWLRDAVGEDYFRRVKSVDFATNMGRKRGAAGPKVDDDSLASLAGLADLETLELSHNESVGDDQLKYLRPLSGLKVLYLFRTSVTGPGLRELVDLPRLEHLSLGQTHVGDEGAKHLGAMRQLRSLDLEYTQITHKGIGSLSVLTKLESLRLNNTAITDAAVADLAKLTSLQELALRGTRISAQGAEQLKQALPSCYISFPFALGKEPDDEPITLPGEKLTAVTLNARFKSRGIDGNAWPPPGDPNGPIVQLYLGESTLSDRVLQDLLARLPDLDSLVVRKALLGDEVLAKIGAMNNLAHLELSETRVTDQGLEHLTNLTNIRDLVLNQSEITDAGLEFLAQLKSLQQLVLEDLRVTREGAKKLKIALPKCNVTY